MNPVSRPTRIFFAILLVVLCVALLIADTGQPTVHVASMDSVGPRPLEKQTQSSVVRDYLQAWQTLGSALDQNRADLLDEYFVGVAKDKLANTIREQHNFGITSAYHARSHDLQIVFYSPEGLSIQLLDNVEYDVEVREHGKAVATQHVSARYLAVLTPTESKWKVRVLQGGS